MNVQDIITWQSQRISELEQQIAMLSDSRLPELAINESVHLHRNMHARFDGTLVVLETIVTGAGTVQRYPRLFIPPALMASLFWFNRRVVSAFPEAYMVKYEDIIEI